MKPPAASVLLLAALATIAGCADAPAPTAPLRDYNVVLINVDTLRADRLGCYGHTRDTTPFLDRMASEGVRFERSYSTSSYTRPSVASLLTGLLPTAAGSIGWAGAIAPGAETLAERFAEAGYRTGFFSNTAMLQDPLFTQGFDTVAHLARTTGISRAGPVLSDRALEFAGAHADEKLMLYLHYLDPHAPYDPPEENILRFSSSVAARPLSLVGEVRPNLEALRRQGFGPGEARFEDLRLRYDAEISHTDDSIARLVAGLERFGLLDRTLVVVTADHGEEFLEHDFVEHAWTLFEESLSVPLIFWAPGVLEPRTLDAPVSGVDVLPSLLDLVGIERDGHTARRAESLRAGLSPFRSRPARRRADDPRATDDAGGGRRRVEVHRLLPAVDAARTLAHRRRCRARDAPAGLRSTARCLATGRRRGALPPHRRRRRAAEPRRRRARSAGRASRGPRRLPGGLRAPPATTAPRSGTRGSPPEEEARLRAPGLPVEGGMGFRTPRPYPLPGVRGGAA